MIQSGSHSVITRPAGDDPQGRRQQAAARSSDRGYQLRSVCCVTQTLRRATGFARRHDIAEYIIAFPRVVGEFQEGRGQKEATLGVVEGGMPSQ